MSKEKEGLYKTLKEMEFVNKFQGTILERDFDKHVDYLLQSIITCFGLPKIKGELGSAQSYYLNKILDDEEFWKDIEDRFISYTYSTNFKEEKEMGVYKSWLATVEAGLTNKWLAEGVGSSTAEDVHNLAITGCCLQITALEDRWTKGTISEQDDKWLTKITNDPEYWTDWEEWKKIIKDPSKVGMSKDEYNNMKEKVKKMAEQKAEATALTNIYNYKRNEISDSKTTYSTGTTSTFSYSYNVPPVGFTYHGRKNKTILPEFVDICRMTQKTLKKYLVKRLKRYYDKKDICVRDGFIFVKGEIPVMVTAHMDTVHKEVIKEYYEWTEKQDNKYDVHVLSSPQGIGGDDRCGIWMILQMLEYGYRPFIIFNEDEEIGCVGARKFVKTANNDLHNMCKDIKFIIELDRKGKHDLVFYDCDNKDFTKWCEKTTGWKKAYGSCSDISYLAPAIECAAVNLSCGYYDEHKLWHTVKIEEMFNTLSTAIKMIEASETVERFEYVEAYDNYSYSWGGYRTSGSNYDHSDSDKYGSCVVDFEFWVYDKEADDWITDFATVKGWRYSECYEKFFKRHPNTCYADIVRFNERYDYSNNSYNNYCWQ